MMLRRPILGVLVALISSCGFAQSICYARTPEQALPSGWVAQAKESTSELSADLYRLARVVVDPELHRRWALIANCTHPEWPLQTIALAAGQPIPPTPVAQPLALVQSASVAEQHVKPPAIVNRRAKSSPPAVQPPIAPNYVKPPAPDLSAIAPLIRAGDLVRLWSSDANVRLEMEVVSLEYGHAGQVIHLRRPGQTALLAGVVVGKDSAELIP
jgi:hypothetical protein